MRTAVWRGRERMPAQLDAGPALAGLRLLAPSAVVVALIAAAVVVLGPSERLETVSWVLAFGVALPVGLILGARQERRLASAAPAASWRALACGVALLVGALFVRGVGTGTRPFHAVLLVGAAAALVAPVWAAKRWRDPWDTDSGFAPAVVVVALAGVVLALLPASARHPAALFAAVAIAAALLAAMRASPVRQLSRRERRGLDVLVAALAFGLVVLLPDLRDDTPATLQHHHNFFLGPANAVLHGRTMLVDTWSQYGVVSIDALALLFTIVPIGYGQLFLICVFATGLQFVCVYATLRAAGLRVLLAGVAIAIAALSNILALPHVYATYPSITPLRFGPPYLIVLAAVLGARGSRQRSALVVQLVVVGLAAIWSFETWVYSAATFGFIVVAEALRDRRTALRMILIRAGQALAATAASILLLTIATLIASGDVDWGPYVGFLRLYGGGSFVSLGVVLFSPGPLMAAGIFLSATLLLWLALDRPQQLSAPTRVAIAGFIGFAIGSFTYYVSRSQAFTLMNLLVPAVALGALWVHALLSGGGRPWRTLAAGALLAGGGLLAVWSGAAGEHWGLMAIGKGTGAVRSVERLWQNPVLDARAPAGVALLDRHLPPGERALVITEPDLTTEILLRADRDNVLPIGNAMQDNLVPALVDRARVAAERVPPGTLLLTSPPARPRGQPNTLGGTTDPLREGGTHSKRDFTGQQAQVLAVLERRFAFRPVDRARGGLVLVRLDPR